MTRILLEDLPVLLVLLGLLEFALLFYWARRRDRSSSRVLAMATCACAAMMAVSALVRTPRERVISVCGHLARALDEGDVPAVVNHLHADFALDALGRETVAVALERTLTRFRIDKPRLRRFDVVFSGPQTAVVTFSASARVRSAETVLDRLPTRWRLTMTKNEDWKVLRAESLPVPPLNLHHLGDFLR